MEENTEISTIQEETEETSQAESTTDGTSSAEETSQNDTKTEGTSEETTQETEIDYEKQYKELQAEYTRKSQEFAEYKRQNQPQVIDDNGRPTSQFERQFNHDLTNLEYSAYQNNARYLDAETRAEVEQLLDQANQAYITGNSRGYEEIMAQVKENFHPQFIEQVSEQKAAYKAQKEQYIQNAIAEQRQSNAVNIAQQIEKSPELFSLVNPDSETYSKPVFDIVHQLFDKTGSVDVNLATQAINAIKQQAVNEYKATLALNTQKQQASVLNGDNVQEEKELSLDDKSYWDKMYS